MKKIITLVVLSIFILSCDTSKRATSIKKGNTSIAKDQSKTTIPKDTGKRPVIKEDTINFDEIIFEELDKPTAIAVLNIIDVAKSFHGTPYKFGGTTHKGMDCSGLIYVSFKEENINLPRSSHEIATKGQKIALNDIAKGDLLFFKTNGGKRINHVGLVVDVYPGKVLFIHSSTSQGVIISALDETYWNKAFAEARRVI